MGRRARCCSAFFLQTNDQTVFLSRRVPAKFSPLVCLGSRRCPSGCLAGQRRRSGRHESGLRGADRGRSEGITEREGRKWRSSTWESIWLAHTHTHIRILFPSYKGFYPTSSQRELFIMFYLYTDVKKTPNIILCCKCHISLWCQSFYPSFLLWLTFDLLVICRHSIMYCLTRLPWISN